MAQISASYLDRPDTACGETFSPHVTLSVFQDTQMSRDCVGPLLDERERKGDRGLKTTSLDSLEGIAKCLQIHKALYMWPLCPSWQLVRCHVTNLPPPPDSLTFVTYGNRFQVQ